jgi:hypothetical protein
MHDDELSTLLVAERPRPRETFAAELDARVAARFPPRPRPRAASARRWSALSSRPFLPAAATALALGLAALVVAVNGGGDARVGVGGGSKTSSAVAEPEQAVAGETLPRKLARKLVQSESFAAPAPAGSAGFIDGLTDARKVERSAKVDLGTDPDRVDDVARGVLGVVARFDGIVDSSSVQTAQGGGEAGFELRIPAARLQAALAALSRLPDAHVLSRTDDTRDVNQVYVSVRRRLANARAERAGIVRAFANAATEDETLRLRARLDTLERAIARAERTQRALDRRVDYSRVGVAVHGGADGGTVADDGGPFGIGDAAHDALRVLEVAAGVVVIAAAALVPLTLLTALAWPLGRAAKRRRRESLLDAT